MRRGPGSDHRPEGDDVVPALGNRTSDKRNALCVTVVGEKPELRGEVLQALAGVAGLPLEVQESEPRADVPAGEAGARQTDVAMVLFDGNEELALAYLQHQATQAGRPTLFALLNTRSPVSMRRAIRAGADELLFTPLDGGEVTRALLKISEARLRTERRQSGIVCSLTSVVGGVGVTTLSMNVALALHHALHKQVGLVDLDLQTGGLSVMLNLEPEVSIMPLARLDKKLDSIQLEPALTKHSSGIYLLAAPKRIEESELISDLTVAAVLEVMREMFDFVIVDCGSHVDENAVAAWERSDRLFYVLNQSVVSVRCAWRFIDLFERLGLTTLEPQYVLNRSTLGHAIGEKQLEGTLGRRIFARFPADAKAVGRAELSGQDLWRVAAGSPLVRSLEEFARGLGGPESSAESEGGIISRLFSVFGARS
jgi:pilus assembly protein CpaE